MFRVMNRATSALRCSTSRVSSPFQSTPLPIAQRATIKTIHQGMGARKPANTQPFVLPETRPENLPYNVRRSTNFYLPVYRKMTLGNTRLSITLKKVDGNRRQAVEDMVRILAIPRENIRLNPTTQCIEVQGDYYDRIKQWLLWCGF